MAGTNHQSLLLRLFLFSTFEGVGEARGILLKDEPWWIDFGTGSISKRIMREGNPSNRGNSTILSHLPVEG